MGGIRLAKRTFLSLAAVILTACGPSSPDQEMMPATDNTPAFPTQERGGPQMEALLEGTLISQENCLYLRSDPDGHIVLPVWPHGFYYEKSGNQLTIFNAAQEAVAEVGQAILLGGGLVGEDGQPVPEKIQRQALGCEGPYWIVGSTALPE